jgi:hypothetical protein
MNATRTIVVPYNGSLPAEVVQSAVQSLLGESPGRGLLHLRVVEHLPPPPGRGPGTELHRLLGKVGIRPTPGCKCLAHVAEMDIRGADWCEQNLPLIVGWLRAEATRRRLPFIDSVASLLVRRAIHTARINHGTQAEAAKG